ncbi:ubiquitin carboxyl-terminal hydrolase family protein [Actinidia rufa]|uniref:Ubiquitin carboxyl-terminal hydrolase family protein n=1 Tax=Actinidia rufa TaxID=165716 RepID=A0A7J0EGT8_9ERIC|nr:ubiquitin carboxyl-terminal hydrolase family protein [Actinidia rufa]
MMFLVEEEQSVKDIQDHVFAERLAKLLMMSSNQRLNVMKINELKRNFGFPDDYLIRIVPKYPEIFRLVNYCGRRSSMEIELVSWKPDLAVSSIEMKARKQDQEPCFSCSLPSTWIKSWERFHEFDSLPYISPYSELTGFSGGIERNGEENSWFAARITVSYPVEESVNFEVRTQNTDMSEEDDQGGDNGGIFNPEERKRFYRVLFDDSAP